MTITSSTVRVRRSFDRSHHRKPLRVQITRRRTGKGAEAPPSDAADKSDKSPSPQFVTQVRFGGAEAVIVPWGLAAAVNGSGSGSAPVSASAAPTRCSRL
jgi:hypothetical protein